MLVTVNDQISYATWPWLVASPGPIPQRSRTAEQATYTSSIIMCYGLFRAGFKMDDFKYGATKEKKKFSSLSSKQVTK